MLIVEGCLPGASGEAGRRGSWRETGQGRKRAPTTAGKVEGNLPLSAFCYCAQYLRESISRDGSSWHFKDCIRGQLAPLLLRFRMMEVGSLCWNKAAHLTARTQERERSILPDTVPSNSTLP